MVGNLRLKFRLGLRPGLGLRLGLRLRLRPGSDSDKSQTRTRTQTKVGTDSDQPGLGHGSDPNFLSVPGPIPLPAWLVRYCTLAPAERDFACIGVGMIIDQLDKTH